MRGQIHIRVQDLDSWRQSSGKWRGFVWEYGNDTVHATDTLQGQALRRYDTTRRGESGYWRTHHLPSCLVERMAVAVLYLLQSNMSDWRALLDTARSYTSGLLSSNVIIHHAIETSALDIVARSLLLPFSCCVTKPNHLATDIVHTWLAIAHLHLVTAVGSDQVLVLLLRALPGTYEMTHCRTQWGSLPGN